MGVFTILKTDPLVPNPPDRQLGNLHRSKLAERPAIALALFRATATLESATNRHQNKNISELHTSNRHLDHRGGAPEMLATAPHCLIENQMRHSQALKLLGHLRLGPTAEKHMAAQSRDLASPRRRSRIRTDRLIAKLARIRYIMAVLTIVKTVIPNTPDRQLGNKSHLSMHLICLSYMQQRPTHTHTHNARELSVASMSLSHFSTIGPVTTGCTNGT